MSTNEQAEDLLNIPKEELADLVKDAVKSAEAVNLVYINDGEPGIQRIKKGEGFSYVFNNKQLKDKAHMQRIKSLVIPPAWTNVWICAQENGHLQVTGIDQKSRKQYKYHPLWNQLRNQTKFYRLHDFGKALPAMRLQLEKDIAKPGMPVEKVLATVVSLMERTNIRVGNNFYEKLYGSFGLTTLKDKHVKINGTELRFTFKGKKGVHHDISIKSKRIARIVKECRDIPGKELFQYINDAGEHKTIDSGMVNNYIREISGGDFTAKDFRTWAGTVHALLAFKDLGFGSTQTESKKNVVAALDIVSKHLGNTRTVCKKYYVHPALLTLYEDKSLEKYMDELNVIEKNDNKADLTVEEKVLMKILSEP
ncbi:MAG: DNA topoisomerase IB [Williamsia sp.]|nr:DNA topoisomerase IB [Williamsia sp.]